MKRLLISIAIACFALAANAEDLLSIPYKNIGENDKIKVENNIWTTKISRHNENYFVKHISEGSGSFSEYYDKDGIFKFTTDCQYEFINKNNFFGYANHELKFYEFTYSDEVLFKRELALEEIQQLFPNYKIIKISDFSKNTNSLKIKKNKHHLKIILLNDTDREFYHYAFYSGNSKYLRYNLNGLLDITKTGMIQFSHFGDNTKDNPCYVLLVR